MLQWHPPVISRKSANTGHVVAEKGTGRGNNHLMMDEYLAGFYWKKKKKEEATVNLINILSRQSFCLKGSVHTNYRKTDNLLPFQKPFEEPRNLHV